MIEFKGTPVCFFESVMRITKYVVVVVGVPGYFTITTLEDWKIFRVHFSTIIFYSQALEALL